MAKALSHVTLLAVLGATALSCSHGGLIQYHGHANHAGHVHVEAHGHSHDHGRSLLEGEGYKCPACNMNTMMNDYNNEFFVEMEHGQRVYTCGMDPRTFEAYDFEITDSSYVAANMAEYIVNSKDEKDFKKCKNECPECVNKIKDPVSGEAISSDNFRYVCIKEGQKIYFASDKTRNEYLTNVNKEPRYLVKQNFCGASVCKDADRITKVSPAAASFVPELVAETDGSKPGSTPASTPSPSSTAEQDNADTNKADTQEQPFCTGASVMFNGFQSTIHNTCVRLFFQPWVLDSGFKYAVGFFGIIGMAMFNEYLAKFREGVRKTLRDARKQRPQDKAHKISCKLLLSFLYMCQMSIAYLAMLVVMIYDSGLFIALILGFGLGFIAFKSFDMDVSEERGVWRFTDPSTVCLRVEGMKCMANCGSTVEAALSQVPGVTNAVVIFDEHSAYVAGSADMTALIDAVESVGFSAEAATAAISQRV